MKIYTERPFEILATQVDPHLPRKTSNVISTLFIRYDQREI
jgi:hypothetical protein